MTSAAEHAQLPPGAFTLSVCQRTDSAKLKRVTFLKLTDFADFIKRQKAVDSKLSSVGIVASLFLGDTRSNENITEINAALLDFDDVPNVFFQSVCVMLKMLNINFVAWATWSNHGRFAVAIPFAESTDVAGHAAAVAKLRADLEEYGNFAAESSRPGQLRFISPNPDNPHREFEVYADGELLKAPKLGNTIDAEAWEHVDGATQQSEQQAPAPRREEALSDLVSPAHKQLFLIALRHQLLSQTFYTSYLEWFPIVAAAMRAWGLADRRPIKLSQDQMAMLEILTAWCEAGPGYVKGSLEAKIGKCQRDIGPRRQVLGLIKDVDQFELMNAVQSDPQLDEGTRNELLGTLQRLGAGNPQVSVPVYDKVAIETATTERKAEADKLAVIRLKAVTILASMPTPTPRFGEFKEILVSLLTENQAEPWELTEESWPYFLRPAPMLVGLLQIAGLGFAPHTSFRVNPSRAGKALNPYFLNIGDAGTGKSSGIEPLKSILHKTSFRNSTFSTKLHSATGLWTNFFEQRGNIQLGFSEEAEALIGKNGKYSKGDPNLSSLHTCLKELFDKGVLGQMVYRPSAQVQRELRELNAPFLALHLAGTPSLLRNDINASMMNDGFMSRVITSIDERDDSQLTEEQSFDNIMKGIRAGGSDEVSLDKTTTRAANFFNKLWIDSRHPIGKEFFTAMPDEVTQMIQAHFNNTDLKPRFITFAPDDQEKFGRLLNKAKMRWEFPPGEINTDTGSNIKSLRNRATTKLEMITALLTLVADPQASYLNYELGVWAEKFLYYTQYPFYQHLLSADHEALTGVPAHKLNQKMMDKLRTATQPGGMLFKGPCDSNTLRKNRAWRTLLEDLKKPETSDSRKSAFIMLDALNVSFQDGENNKRTFHYYGGMS